MSEISEDFQYNSCISRGICSLSPKTSALQTVLVLYLRMFAKFGLKLEEKKLIPKNVRDFILNVISITIYNLDFNENSFISLLNNFRKILPLTIEKYYEHNSDLGDELNLEKEKAKKLFNETESIISAIKFGEKSLKNAQQKLNTELRDFYNIMLVVLKSLSINILDLDSFNVTCEKSFFTTLKILSYLDIEGKNIDKIKQLILEAVAFDSKLSEKLRKAQVERYGEQNVVEVSYSTYPNKAVLVVGSNLRELETVLENLKDENIDIYTHDEMMLAHTFPKFAEYKNLKGQYGQGIENCLLDFATFPGPIILTKHSLHNIENLYRGRLFSTDLTIPKGVIKIENNNYKDVIDSAKSSKGFKTGKQCESIQIGFKKDEVFEQIKTSLSSNKYDKFFIIGLEGYSLKQKAYFEKLIKLAPENVLIISFSYNFEKNNLIHINACFDSYSVFEIFDYLTNFDIEKFVFIPKCDRNSISQMINISNVKKTQIYLGDCTPILLNPTLLKTLSSEFSIKNITSVKKDLEDIIKN